ncbi:MAG: hypothetical protein KDC87_08900 [Planctomycetes bacterium]|nr:hypothetical protein [Planctomycetota bacterium]
MQLPCEAHPLLDLRAFTAELAPPLGGCPSPDWLTMLLRPDAPAPVMRSEAVRTAVRNMLRLHGYKPTGRGKPASEYLLGAAEQGRLGTINPVVDANNAVSLHSGLPASVLDAALLGAPLRVAPAQPGVRYVFNRAGQEIDVGGLPCLHDSFGPCANAVKDAQRAKTGDGTLRVLVLLWGVREQVEHVDASLAWYRALLLRAGIASEQIECRVEQGGE